MPGAEQVGERDIVGLVVVHTRLHVGSAADQSLKYTNFSVADPGSGIRCLFNPWIQGPGWVKKSGYGPGMNNPHRISESLEPIF
jgi:hypothetical protein